LNIAVKSSNVVRKPVYRIFGGMVDQKASIIIALYLTIESSAKYCPYAAQKTLQSLQKYLKPGSLIHSPSK